MACVGHQLGDYSIQQNILNVKNNNGFWNVDKLVENGYWLGDYIIQINI